MDVKAGIFMGLLGVVAMGCTPKYPNCKKDKHCEQGEFCVQGQCQQCRDDTDCSEGQVCSDGACEAILGYCANDPDCAEGETCTNNRCTAVATAAPIATDTTGTETPAKSECAFNTIFFAYDADQLDGGARDHIQSNLQCMREKKVQRLHLTGHADPRGTEEYNLALGERRARAVKQYLISLGAASDAVSLSSMGEEMSSGEHEEHFAKERRVEVIPQ